VLPIRYQKHEVPFNISSGCEVNFPKFNVYALYIPVKGRYYPCIYRNVLFIEVFNWLPEINEHNRT